jgi:hypothetical protein
VRFGADKTYFASRLLLVIFFVTYGLSLVARSGGLLIAVYVAAAVIATIFILRKQPNPKLILMLATGVVALSLAMTSFYPVIS